MNQMPAGGEELTAQETTMQNPFDSFNEKMSKSQSNAKCSTKDTSLEKIRTGKSQAKHFSSFFSNKATISINSSTKRIGDPDKDESRTSIFKETKLTSISITAQCNLVESQENVNSLRQLGSSPNSINTSVNQSKACFTETQSCPGNHSSKSKEQRSTIDLLLSNQKPASSKIQLSTINDLVICERCGKRLLVWDLPDHMDFHFAKDLQDSLRDNFFGICSNSSRNNSIIQNKRKIYDDRDNETKLGSNKKKFKKNGASSSSTGGNTLSKYFSPTKKPK